MSEDNLREELERLKAENEALKQGQVRRGVVTLKVSDNANQSHTVNTTATVIANALAIAAPSR